MEIINHIKPFFKDHPALTNSQKVALEKLDNSNPPTKKLEDWRHTSLDKCLENSLVAYKDEVFNLEKYKDLYNSSFPTMFFYRGKLQEDVSTLSQVSDSIKLTTTENQINEDEFFNILNQSANPNKHSLIINSSLEKPLQIVYLDDQENGLASTNIEISLVENVNAEIIEIFSSTGSSLHHYKTKFNLEAHAKLTHIKVQKEHDLCAHFQNSQFDLEESSCVKSIGLTFGGKLARQELTANLNKEESHFSAYQFSFVQENQQVDQVTTINHNVGKTGSDQLFKSLIKENGRSIFNGKIQVAKNASLVESSQQSKAILLHRKGRAISHPILLIDNHDVKCAHGSTVGQLNKDQLFYLQSRCISPDRAKSLLNQGFAQEILDKIGEEQNGPFLRNWLFKFLEQSGI